ncbi:MAG: hypothetical protein AABY85_08965 [Gemmatimonadota bacterium]
MSIRRALLATAVLAGAVAPALRAQDLRGIWGSGPADIWVVGDRPAAVHFDGQNWNEVPFGVSLSGDLNAVWGSGPRDVFAVGDNGMVLHWDGTRWARQSTPVTRELIAVGGRSATEVYALAQSTDDREAPALLRYDGRTWTATPLPLPFRANGMAMSGADVVVAGFIYQDPTPNERRQAGIVARMSGGRWTMTGWDGQRMTDPVVGGAGWTGLSAAGSVLLLVGERDDGSTVMALFSGTGWTTLPPAASAMSNTRIERVVLVGDATPVALYDGPGFARYAAGRWAAVVPMANMQQMMMQQMMQGQRGQAPPAQQQQQMQQMQQMMANPMMFAARMAAFDMSDARAAWGVSSADFYVVTGQGRVAHIVGDDATLAYDATCGDPMQAGMNPVCQMIEMQRQGPPR